jgi:enoyl-CoA hydratase/carnithine racemase
MQQIFDYQNFELKLDPAFKILRICIKKERNELNLEFLFELESILAWCTQHTEINALFFESDNAIFAKGLNAQSELEEKYLQKISDKLQIITQAMSYLPQTLIADLGMGAENLGIDFALGMDLRLINREGAFEFNHAAQGIAPVMATAGILMNNFGKGIAANFLLGNEEVDAYALKESGLVYKFYNDKNKITVLDKLFTTIFNQAPVQRIQTKGLLNELSRIKLAKNFEISKRYLNASIINHDFKEGASKEYMDAKGMATVIDFAQQKLKLQTDDLPVNEH